MCQQYIISRTLPGCSARLIKSKRQTSKDVDADMVCDRPSSCYGLRYALKFRTMAVDTPLNRALGNVGANFDFFDVFFVFELGARAGQTDRWTRRVMWPRGRPHKHVSFFCWKHRVLRS